MPYKCSVYGCTGNYDRGIKVSVFQFPKDPEQKQIWTKRMMRKNFTPTKNSRVCELHFDEVDIEREASFFDERTNRLLTSPIQHPRLKVGAVPLYPLVPNFATAKGKPSKDPSNPSKVFNAKPKATTSKKNKKQKILASPEEVLGPTSETAQAWNSVLHLQPIESEASTSGVSVPPQSQHDATEPTDSSTETAESDGSTPKEKPKFKYSQRKVARSPSPTANDSVQSLTDPLKLCIVKMEIEDDGYNEEENYLTSLPDTSSQQSQINASLGDPKTIKTERNRELEPIIFKVASSIDYSESSPDSREDVETFFKNVAETVVQLPLHLIEETKVKISSLVYEMVIQAISEGCTNIQQPDL